MISAAAAPVMWGKSTYSHPGEFLGSGNRCGHDPLKPRFDLFQPTLTAEKRYPMQLQKLIDAIDSYYWSPDNIPTLAFLRGTRNTDGRYRCNRSEAREGQVLLMKAILAMTDFASLRVGTPLANGDFIHRSIEEIARHAGLMTDADVGPDGEPRIPSRVWRLLDGLKASGFLELFQQYEIVKGEFEITPDGRKKPKYRARPAIKTISRDYLLSLGAISAKSLAKFQRNRSQRLLADQADYKEVYKDSLQDEAEEARQRLRLKQALGGTYKKQSAKPDPRAMPKASRSEDREAYSRAKVEAVVILMGASKGRKPAEIRAQIDREFLTFDDWLRLRRSPS